MKVLLSIYLAQFNNYLHVSVFGVARQFCVVRPELFFDEFEWSQRPVSLLDFLEDSG